MNDLNNVNNENQTVSSPIAPPVSSGVYNPGVKLPQGPVVTKKTYPVDNKDFYFFIFVSVASFIFIRLGVLGIFALAILLISAKIFGVINFNEIKQMLRRKHG